MDRQQSLTVDMGYYAYPYTVKVLPIKITHHTELPSQLGKQVIGTLCIDVAMHTKQTKISSIFAREVNKEVHCSSWTKK